MMNILCHDAGRLRCRRHAPPRGSLTGYFHHRSTWHEPRVITWRGRPFFGGSGWLIVPSLVPTKLPLRNVCKNGLAETELVSE